MIPVETLSAIYEQFLHANKPEDGRPRGKELGAYYTPIPLVNFMLNELDNRQPLQEGMTCFDASCGSGAFLVQCYRRLIEGRVLEDGMAIRRPAELRDLLVKHIFGVDRDGDACRVTELSLILTLLDYVDPPDLLPVHNFKLPDLHDRNIFEADFFDPASSWARSAAAPDRRYDWVVGNPPWVELRPQQRTDQEGAKDLNRHARKWIGDNKKSKPTGGDQLAEAFLWKVAENLKPSGIAGMLVPAMTLFKSEATELRRRFFGELNVWCVANFANLAYVLFARRAETPAAAIFYSPRMPGSESGADSAVLCYSPLVASQEPNRPDKEREKKDTWSIVVNASEVREIEQQEAASGDSFVWKIAMWGSRLDRNLLHSVAARFDSLQAVRLRLRLDMNEGCGLRLAGKGAVPVPELINKFTINRGRSRGHGRLYAFPNDSLIRIERRYAHLREGRDDLPMRVSRPPHVIVDTSRRFAIYSDMFLHVPARTIGIAGQTKQADLLKAMSLFLASDFTVYHQFLTSPQFGVYKSIADLENLKELPFPIDGIQRGGLRRWTDLHAALVAAARAKTKSSTEPLYANANPTNSLAQLEGELNQMVSEALGLRGFEEWLISDLVHVRMKLIKGKIDRVATRPPMPEDMRAYALILKQELDSFVEVATEDRHVVEVIHDRAGAMIVVRRVPPVASRDSVLIRPADSDDARALRDIRQKLLRKHSQWLYFERGLTCYMNGSTYLFKPMQRLHWLRSQALVDAGEIIADRAGGGGQ